jgi:hypothetical protein
MGIRFARSAFGNKARQERADNDCQEQEKDRFKKHGQPAATSSHTAQMYEQYKGKTPSLQHSQRPVHTA